MIEPGQTVGNYRVTAKLGGGGMGAVYLAEHPVIGRRAALKVINPQYARNTEVVTRFVTEATAINRIGHEHIVEVTDFGRTPSGDFYFIMEYLEGETLADKIARDSPFAPEEAGAIAAQIADALAASHAHGVIHRDLKPENIFIVTRGEDSIFVKVLDFGLAKLVDEEFVSANRTLAGTVMGTPYYMAPEQCEGRNELDGRADVYSLGVVLFEMLTGQVPFDGASYSEVFAKQLTMPAPSAREHVPGVPEVFDRILSGALAKEPAKRFSSMVPFRDALLAASRPAPAALPRDTLPDEPGLDRVPRQRGPRVAALVFVSTIAGMGLALGLTSASTLPPEAAMRRMMPPPVQMGEQDGGDASAVGLAAAGLPLDAGVPLDAASPLDAGLASDAALSADAAVPDAGSASDALDDGPEIGTPPPVPILERSPRHRHARVVARLRDDGDGDGILAPSFAK